MSRPVCGLCMELILDDEDHVCPPQEHPSFTLAKSLAPPWDNHFPKSAEEAHDWSAARILRPLGARVLAVARTRVECAWAAYIDSVPGINHREEANAVLSHGDKLSELVARSLFPQFEGVPYAD